MHYPLAMLLLALMDQRTCKELEEPGPQRQNKEDRKRTEGWQWERRENGRRACWRDRTGFGMDIMYTDRNSICVVTSTTRPKSG